jgi:uroporphyrinogen-III synthase
MPVIAIGPQTAAEARAVGLDVVAVAEPHTLDGLVDALGSTS